MKAVTRYWKGSESHNAYYKATKIFKDKIKVFEVSPIASQVFKDLNTSTQLPGPKDNKTYNTSHEAISSKN